MSRPVVTAVVAALVAAGLATVADGPAALLLAVAGGAAVGVVGMVVERRRTRELAREVGAWLGEQGYRPLRPRAGTGWDQLAIALNALGAAFQRRADKLARERPWRRQLVDALVDPALLFSDEGRLLAANDAARELFSVPIDAADVTVVQAVGSAALVDAVRESRSRGEAVTVDAEHGDHDLRAVVSQVGDESLLLVTDRTRERRVEEIRRNFVVNASHELKTPVTAIRTLAEALAVTVDRDDPDKLRGLLRRLDLESQRLAQLVYDLLDLRRLEDRGPLERVPVDLAELIRQTVANAVDRADERGIELSVDAPDHAFVAGVPGDLQVIVKNLVGNAIQYNRAGGEVEVEVRRRGGDQLVTVRDTGIGVPQQDLVRIFERFYRVDSARSRETGGTGLGLSIVRHAVERHGGTIRVDSLLGEGTTFTVTLPIEPAS